MEIGNNPNLFAIEFQQAVSGIQNRAEKQADDYGNMALKETFVDAGILVQIQNSKNQIVIGRRGSGKTHLVLKLADQVLSKRDLFFALDCRFIGSGLFTLDPPQLVALRIFRSFTHKFESWALDELAKRDSLSDKGREIGLLHLTRMGELIPRNQFSEYSSALTDFIYSMGAKKLFIILDEWVNIPQDIQPHLAELFKKTFFPNSNIVIKIASIEFQSTFGKPIGNGMLGFEVGADIFLDVDLDTYLVYDRDEKSVEEFFASVLYKHLSIALGLGNLKGEAAQKWLVKQCFTQGDAFRELVRACEGVPRDLLQIFSRAYFDALKTNQKLSIANVRKAAEYWYSRDKLNNVRDDGKLSGFLNDIIDEVIGKKKGRAFLIEQSISRHPLILKLFDLRLLHLIKRGWSHQGKSGVRYDILSIDYGAYVSLRNTAKEPQIEFEFHEPNQIIEEDKIVPFDDLRSIRRIELTSDFISRYSLENVSDSLAND